MPFNTNKCEIIAFSNITQADPMYTLGGNQLRYVQEARYLGIQMQSNLRFDKHISEKIKDASKVLGCIKFTLYKAPEQGKLLAYTSLCRPILEYGDTLRDPPDKKSINDIELLQNKAIWFVKNIQGCSSVSKARSQLQLQSLQDRRKSHRLSLLMKVFSDDTKHQTLASTYEELKNSWKPTTVFTRAASRREPTSIFASSQGYYNSFLPCSVRDLKLNTLDTKE